MCPDEGWSGALKLGFSVEAAAIIKGAHDVFLEWKFGTPFNLDNIDAKVSGNVGFGLGFYAKAGVKGSAEGKWYIIEDK